MSAQCVFRAKWPVSLEHPSWLQVVDTNDRAGSRDYRVSERAAARDDSCADVSAQCRAIGECSLPGARRGSWSDIGCRRAFAATRICHRRSTA
jgi:hypothetical protein